MKKKAKKRSPGRVSVRAGQVEFVKVNTDRWQWRDAYRWLLGLRWPQFAALVAGVYVGLNLFFAALFSLEPESIAGSTGGHWFFDCFFQCADPGHGWLRPHVSPNALWPRGHHGRDHERYLFVRGDYRAHFRAVLSTSGAHCFQQLDGDRAVERALHPHGAHRQSESAHHGGYGVSDHVYARRTVA